MRADTSFSNFSPAEISMAYHRHISSPTGRQRTPSPASHSGLQSPGRFCRCCSLSRAYSDRVAGVKAKRAVGNEDKGQRGKGPKGQRGFVSFCVHKSRCLGDRIGAAVYAVLLNKYLSLESLLTTFKQEKLWREEVQQILFNGSNNVEGG